MEASQALLPALNQDPDGSDGRKNPEGRKYQIKELWAIHHEIIRRLLLGQKSKEIAEDLKISPVLVSYTKNSALGKRHLELMQGAIDRETVDVRVRIKQMAATAAKVLDLAMSEDQPMALRVKSATEVLDRAGHVKVIKTENLHAHLTAEDIEAIKQRAREEGVVVDVQATEVLGDQTSG